MFGDGSKNAEIAFIADYLTYHEQGVERLFIGGTKWVYDQQLRKVGLSREKVWTTALFSAPSKNLGLFYKDKAQTILKSSFFEDVTHLAQELQDMPNLKVIVPMGNASLQQLCGLKGLSNWRGSILPIRKNFSPNSHKQWKAVPTHSPHELNVSFSLRVYTDIDLKRVVRETKTKGIKRPYRRSFIAPTFLHARDYLQNLIRTKGRLGVDIEATGREMTCISFAPNPLEAMCIPYHHTNMTVYWTNPDEFRIIDNLVRQIIEDPNIPKILQNGMFDFWFLTNIGYIAQGFYFDTMYASHCLFCELAKDLGTLTSVYTEEPYYKFERTEAKKEFDREIKPMQKELKKFRSEAKKLAKKRATCRRRIIKALDLKETVKRLENIGKWGGFCDESAQEIHRLGMNMYSHKKILATRIESFELKADHNYWLYNDKDSQVTFEIADKLDAELKSRNLREFYQKYYINMFPIAFDMTMRGIKIDTIRRAEVTGIVENGLETLRHQLFEVIGKEFNTASSVQMVDVLYNTLRLPAQMKKGRITVDAKALERLALRVQHPALEIIMDIRKLEKLHSTYVQSILEDGRMKGIANIATTVTGRWSFSKSFWGSGGNLQNIPSGKTEMSDKLLDILQGNKNIIKDFFIPSTPDHEFTEVDLSNADTWFTAFRAKDKMLVQALLDGKDTHEIVWSTCYDVPIEKIREVKVYDLNKYKTIRGKMKTVGHGFNYGRQDKAIAMELRIPLNMMQTMMERLRSSRPAIIQYHRWVEEQIMEKHCLVNAWGRPRYFFGRIPIRYVGGKKVAVSDEIYRSGYAQIPQSSVADTIGHAALRLQDLLYKAFPQLEHTRYDFKAIPDVRIVTQTHDSLLLEHLKSMRPKIIELIWEAFDFTMCPWGQEFQIPWEYTIGDTWGSLKEISVENGRVID